MARTPAASARIPDSDSRERILAAALEAFSENGFDGATTRDIATRAGVNQGLIKYYFDGKLKLWREAVDRAFEALRGTLDASLLADGSADEIDQMRQLTRRYVRFVASHPEFIRLMHDEGKRSGSRMRWIVDRHVRPMYTAITAVLDRARERGLLPAHVPSVHFHYILIGAVGLMFHQAEECRRLSGIDLTDETVIETHADAVVHLLFGPGHEEVAS
jgi:AcrR family transcriptional regulator